MLSHRGSFANQGTLRESDVNISTFNLQLLNFTHQITTFKFFPFRLFSCRYYKLKKKKIESFQYYFAFFFDDWECMTICDLPEEFFLLHNRLTNFSSFTRVEPEADTVRDREVKSGESRNLFSRSILDSPLLLSTSPL